MGPDPEQLEHLEMARRHLIQANARVARQRELLADLREQGYPTALALDLLNALVETTRQMQAHYDHLSRRLGES